MIKIDDRLLKLFASIFIWGAMAALGTILIQIPSNWSWYFQLRKPFFPLFFDFQWGRIAIVFIFLTAALSFYLIWENEGRPRNKKWERGLILGNIRWQRELLKGRGWKVNLFFNIFLIVFLTLCWFFIFFHQHNLQIALIFSLLTVILVTSGVVNFFRISKVAGYLLIPYGLWFLALTVFNYYLWFLNL